MKMKLDHKQEGKRLRFIRFSGEHRHGSAFSGATSVLSPHSRARARARNELYNIVLLCAYTVNAAKSKVSRLRAGLRGEKKGRW